MFDSDTLRTVIIYTDPVYAQRVAEDCLKHHKVPFSYLRDENGNIWAILFETSILDLVTHEISEIH